MSGGVIFLGVTMEDGRGDTFYLVIRDKFRLSNRLQHTRKHLTENYAVMAIAMESGKEILDDMS